MDLERSFDRLCSWFAASAVVVIFLTPAFVKPPAGFGFTRCPGGKNPVLTLLQDSCWRAPAMPPNQAVLEQMPLPQSR